MCGSARKAHQECWVRLEVRLEVRLSPVTQGAARGSGPSDNFNLLKARSYANF